MPDYAALLAAYGGPCSGLGGRTWAGSGRGVAYQETAGG
jgi:hypothetical protein